MKRGLRGLRRRTCKIDLVVAIESFDTSFGGPPVVAHNILTAAREMGLIATSFSFDRSAREKSSIHPISLFKRVTAMARAWVLAGTARHVHIHGFYTFTCVWFGIACWLRRTPFTIHAHGVFEPYEQARHRLKKWVWNVTVGRLLLGQCAAVVVATDREMEGAKRVVGATAIRVIANGLDPVFNQPPSSDESALRNKTVLFAGRLAPKKRVDILLAAWASVASVRPDARLLIAGGGDSQYVDYLHGYNDDLGNQNVCFVGRLAHDDVVDFLDSGRIFVLVSENENFGNSVLEAASRGCAIVCTQEVAFSNSLRAASAGIVLSQSKLGDLASEIGTLLDCPGRAAELGERAAKVSSMFSWRVFVDQLLVGFSETAFYDC